MAENDPGGITIASYLLPPAGLLGKLGNLAKLGKLGNLLGKSGKLLGAKLGALLGKTGKSLKSIANKVIRWVTDPVDPVTGAYCDERTDFTLARPSPLLHPFPQFCTAAAWPDGRGLERLLERIRLGA